MASAVKILKTLESEHFDQQRKQLTAKIREQLAAELADAENAQAKAIADASKLKSVSDSWNADKDNFYGKLTTIIEAGHEKGFSAYEVVCAVDEVLGRADTIDAKASSVRAYRSFFPRAVALRYDDGAYAEAAASVKDGKGSPVGLDAGGKLKPLTAIGYTAQRNMVKFADNGKDEILYASEVARLNKMLKELAKGKGADEEAGTVALDAMPIAERLEFVRSVIARVPKRPARKAKAGEQEQGEAVGAAELQQAAEDDQGADADDGQDVAQVAKAANQ
jgi:hypothetical protein